VCVFVPSRNVIAEPNHGGRTSDLHNRLQPPRVIHENKANPFSVIIHFPLLYWPCWFSRWRLLSRALISRLPELRGVLSHVKGSMTQWHCTTESQQNIANRASTLGTGFRQSQCILFHVLELRHICNYWYLQLPCVDRSNVPCRESRDCGLSFTKCYDACKSPRSCRSSKYVLMEYEDTQLRLWPDAERSTTSEDRS
jgi:hypothetical protein